MIRDTVRDWLTTVCFVYIGDWSVSTVTTVSIICGFIYTYIYLYVLIYC